jgi:hypothetical protein
MVREDGFYDAGEGAAGIQVQIIGQSSPQPVIIETMAAGGYQTLLDPGQYQVKFLKGDLLLSSRNFAIDSQKPANIKIDLNLDQLIPSVLPNLLKVTGNLALSITPGQPSGSGVNEFGVFAVDDALGKIGNLLPGQDGYILAALGRSQNVLATLGGGFFDPSYSRQVAWPSGQLLRFVMTKNETLQEAKTALEAGKTPSALILQESSSLTDGILNLTDGSGNVLLKTTIAPQPQTIGNALQNPSEIMDLSGVNNIIAKFTVKSDAYYKNEVGFYAVDDALTGRIGTLNPGDSGYGAEAIRRSVIKLNSTSGSVVEVTKPLTGNAFLAPYLVADGAQTYFAYVGANSDRVDHIRLLGDNTFGFEDMAGGGDRDFNDVVLGVKFG